MKESPAKPALVLNLDDQFFSKLARFALALIGFGFLLFLLPQLERVIYTLVIAIMVTSVLEPIVTWLENRGLNRIGGCVLVFVLLSALLTVVISFVAPTIGEQLSALSSRIKGDASSGVLDNLKNLLMQSLPFLNSPELHDEINSKATVVLNEILAITFSTAITILTSFPYVIIIAFAVFFFLKDGRRIKRALIETMPNRYFEISLILVHRISEQIGRYIRGQLIVSMIIGSLSIFALTLLEIPYSFFIGALAGLANMIPYFGPLLGFILAGTVGLIETQSFASVMAIAAAFATIQLIDNVLVSPYVVSRSVELHPLLIIVVILIGSALMGLWGMLLAVPVASVVKVTWSAVQWGVRNYRLHERMRFSSSEPL